LHEDCRKNQIFASLKRIRILKTPKLSGRGSFERFSNSIEVEVLEIYLNLVKDEGLRDP